MESYQPLELRDLHGGAWHEGGHYRPVGHWPRRAATVAQDTATEVRAHFHAGTAAQLDVIQADRDAINALVERIRAQGELSISGLLLQRAAGPPVQP